MPMTVGDQVGRIIGGTSRLDGDAPERRGRGGRRALVRSSRSTRAATASCTSATTSPRCATSTRRSPTSRSTSARTTAAIVDAIDERTLLVPISHVLFKTGEIQDVEPIIRRAHEVGAHVILDCYQSAGIVPFDVTALDVDFAVGGSVKWLCGGPGNGWLYVRPDLAESLDPDLHRLAGARAAVRLRGGDGLRNRRRPLPHRHAERPGALRRDRRLRPDRGGRRRADPRELAAADAAADRPGRRGGVRACRALAPRSGAAEPSRCTCPSSRPSTAS